MAIDLQVLARELIPSNTSILLGSGSSIPSGAPNTITLAESICLDSLVDFDNTLGLADIGTLVEIAGKRKSMVKTVRRLLCDLQPTQGLLNLPLFDWKDIYTTNYDELIEKAYQNAQVPLRVISSNFDFDASAGNSVCLYKLHGTLKNDRSSGHQSSMVISNGDYELASQYREVLFDTFQTETSRNDFLVVGHSLSDPDLNFILSKVAERKKKAGAPGKLYALIFNRDENRAMLWSNRGFNVAFGGIDDLFAALSSRAIAVEPSQSQTGNVMDCAPALNPVTIDVRHRLSSDSANPIKLFNGGVARYGDIQADLTFSRDLSGQIETQLASGGKTIAYILGPAGFGKSTIARQVAVSLSRRGFSCWEHVNEHALNAEAWLRVAKKCADEDRNALLVVDDAHLALRQIDIVVDGLAKSENKHFRMLLTSSAARWHPRSKTPNIFRLGIEYVLGRLSVNEVHSLLDLFERKTEVSSLVEARFSGFSRQQRFNRLVEKCRSDMFVCMKNIFAFDQLDDIILREYNEVDESLQDVYRTVAAMEACQIRVHRQMVIRVLGITAQYTGSILQSLEGIIEESTVDGKQGIFAWHGRHQVISEIILKYKFHNQEEIFSLFEKVIDSVNPAYEIERHTINEICDPRLGVGRITDRKRQNYLYRKLISVAPAQRVPRHRLIYNQIAEGEYEPAQSEIRLFEKELRIDPPIIRYKGILLLERAKTAKGIADEDRAVILADAAAIIDRGIDRFRQDKSLYSAYLDVGLETLRITGDWTQVDYGLERLQRAADESLDPEMTRIATRYRTRAESISKGN